MTDDNTTETTEVAGESKPEEDSDLVKDLRKQIKELSRDLKAQPSRTDIEANIRATVAREKAIESELTSLNLPAGLSEVVEGKLGDADVTAEAVAEALKAIGFELTDSTDDETPDVADQVNQVASLGNQIANKAKTDPNAALTEKINAADTMDELAEVMAKAGLT